MAATLTAGAPARPRKLLASRKTRLGILYALPVVVYLLVLFVYPIFSTLLLSLKDADGSFTLHWYADALTGVNLSVLITTLRISAETAVLSLVFGFILAQAITRLKPILAGLAMLIVVVPHFISALVRTYGWIIMLGDKGMVNETLTWAPGAPYQLLYNELGVVIGTTSMMLPYTVLLLYGVMRGVDRRLLAAASSMGAGRVTIFRRVYLPLVAPGLASAGLLSFILSLGYYITPALMGGPNQTMIATLINQQVTKENQWNGAAAQGVILLLLTFAGTCVCSPRHAHGPRRRDGRAAPPSPPSASPARTRTSSWSSPYSPYSPYNPYSPHSPYSPYPTRLSPRPPARPCRRSCPGSCRRAAAPRCGHRPGDWRGSLPRGPRCHRTRWARRWCVRGRCSSTVPSCGVPTGTSFCVPWSRWRPMRRPPVP